MATYKIESPTTKQLFEAILNKEYLSLEQIKPKAKQLNILLKDHFCTNDVFITFANVTNTGGYPIFFGANESIYEIALDFNDDFYSLSEEEQSNEIELLGCYTRYFTEFFNI
jgi:hypothetical protein